MSKKAELSEVEKKQNFINQIKQLHTQAPLPNATYYFITLLGTEDGGVQWRCDTQFDGFTETKPRREIRVPSHIIPEKMMKLLNEIHEPGLLINSKKDLALFMHYGGHAIIEKSIADEAFPDIVKPAEMISIYPLGFESVKQLPTENLQHFPTPKMRMKVLNRDNRRCRICGRSPKDYEDLELHIHHIQPWAENGGITREENLVTLCKLCHRGLNPHFDASLFELVESSAKRVDAIIDRHKISYNDGIKQYQKNVQNIYKKRLNKKK
jgi:hypothetical protein